MDELKNRLAALVEASGKSKKQLEEEIGLGNGRLGKWLRGLAAPSMGSLNDLALYFNVSVDYLLGREDTKEHTKSQRMKNEIIAIVEGADLDESKLQLLEMYVRALSNEN